MNQLSQTATRTNKPLIAKLPEPIMYTANVHFTIPRDRKEPVWLMTIMGMWVRGNWEGKIGEYYVGWSDEAPVYDAKQPDQQ